MPVVSPSSLAVYERGKIVHLLSSNPLHNSRFRLLRTCRQTTIESCAARVGRGFVN
jgi:hypothetical protein